MRTLWFLALCLALGTGCSSSDDDGGDKPSPVGTTVFKFSVTNTVSQSPSLTDPLSGPVYGALYLAEEVSVTGPIDGAESKASVEATGVDLTSATESTATWTSPKLAPQTYTFLGFFDVDGNGSASRDPDAGDPVTLPVTNKFDIVDGQETPLTIKFDLVLN
jgi:hypothetical protein